MNIIKRIFYKYIKPKKEKENPWLSYYNYETKDIEFSKKTIYEHLVESVNNSLDYYALNYFNNRITYGEMFRKIDHIAKSLKYLGVKKGDIVSICMPNTPEAVEVFYAINKIGAIADMIHPLSAPNEIEHYLNESKSKILFLLDTNYDKYEEVLINSSVELTVLTGVSISMPKLVQSAYNIMNMYKVKKPNVMDDRFMSFKDFEFLHYAHRKKVNDSGMNYKDTAIILHSGGTTGTPKGIMISNYSFNAFAMQGHINVINVKPKDKVVAILPIFHGFGLGACVHCPLCLKVEVILVPSYDAQRFANIIKKFKPQILAGVPTLWESMMNSRYFEDIDLENLKYVISGGDHLSIGMEEKFNKFLKRHHAKIKVTKGYGMTESTAATAYTFEGVNVPGSVGIPMPGNEFIICKPDTTEEVPRGCEGEICVCGPTLMQGYFNNKEETDKMLILHENGKMYLHTKDAGYIDENGVIFFTQRLKRMIVSSGFNVYPNVIEDVISKHPSVKQVCVVGVKHKYKMFVPKAYIVLNEDASKNIKIEAEIRLLCKKNLSAYAVPKYYEFKKELPKTLHNKIDYKKLEEEGNKLYEEENR